MNTEIWVTLIGSGASLIVAVVSIVMNNRVLGFKVDELTKKVDKHNNLVEKVAIAQRDLQTAFIRIDELKADVKDLRKEVAKHE